MPEKTAALDLDTVQAVSASTPACDTSENAQWEAETQEWLHAFNDVLHYNGLAHARRLLTALLGHAQIRGVPLAQVSLPYKNTALPHPDVDLPAQDRVMLARLLAILRWNAKAMVLRAGKRLPELGGHIATYASIAVLYEVGFNYFFRGAKGDFSGDLVFFQGHSSPGIYARAFLEGRFTQAQLDGFRQEVNGMGLSAYPHPWLMPDFWQFPTVSMGLGPLQAIYQARFMRYLENRQLIACENRKVWAFCGDGEMDEPESVGALTLPVREGCDNLIFVINCNLQRLDGPVRGNGKIVTELASLFLGAGWHVIQVLCGSAWDTLFERDTTGALLKRFDDCVDGDFQTYVARGVAYFRAHFFGVCPTLTALIADYSDAALETLLFQRGGLDVQKVYAAYAAAVAHRGQPVVILAKTIKGFGMGTAGEGMNTAHQSKKMDVAQLTAFAQRFDLPLSETQIAQAAYYRPDPDSAVMQYLQARRTALGGHVPRRVADCPSLTVPDLSIFAGILKGSGQREISTTMAFVRIVSLLLRDREICERIVPIVPDESRTFGMEGLFRQIGIYAPHGQKYEPEDKAQVMYYKESKTGQYLQEGLNEAGAFCSWMAAGTAYSNHGLPMIPFYIYYSMFGFQRIGDFAWAAGDMRARGFLLGATAGRTTLCGEGLQHQDGHNHILSGLIPNCVSYDPTYGYELAVIIQDGLRRMYQNQEDIFYYITVMNENYCHPPMPEGAEDGIVKGMYLLASQQGQVKKNNKPPRLRLLGSGTILNEVRQAADWLVAHYGVAVQVWSVTSFTELRRDACKPARRRQRQAGQKITDQVGACSHVDSCLNQGLSAQSQGDPVVAVTDYVRLFADQIREFVRAPYYVLGTDGFGRSDTRANLRAFFEVDARSVAYTGVYALVKAGQLPASALKTAVTRYKIDPHKADPCSQ